MTEDDDHTRIDRLEAMVQELHRFDIAVVDFMRDLGERLNARNNRKTLALASDADADSLRGFAAQLDDPELVDGLRAALDARAAELQAGVADGE